jgi:phage tail sheath protein FI
MPDEIVPGVFIDEGASPPSIAQLATDVAGFVGVAEPLGAEPPPGDALTSSLEFSRYWSTVPLLAGGGPNLLWGAVRAFFENGGRRLHVAPVSARDVVNGGHVAAAAALAATDAAILAAPDVQALQPGAAAATMAALVALAEPMGSNRFAILDAPPGLDGAAVRAWRADFDTPSAALYWPWLRTTSGALAAPSAFVAGAIARCDIDRGVWKAPANIELLGIGDPQTPVGDAEQGKLNPDGINAIRRLQGRGVRIWGARTLSRDPGWRYVPVRRLASMIEASIARGLGWTVFEPMAPALWQRVAGCISAFVYNLWRNGGVLGDTPDKAFFVRCDATTMTAADVADGRIVVQVGYAPVKPDEFLVLRITAFAVPP